MEDPNVIQLSSEAGYPSTGTLRFDPENDELILTILFGENPSGDPRVVHVPEFQVLARWLEESMLLNGCYIHPGGRFSFSAESSTVYKIYVDNYGVADVNRQKLLDLIRRFARTRMVVTNVPRPPDPVLKTLHQGEIFLRDGNLVFDMGGQSEPDDLRTYPINLAEFSLAYKLDQFPLDLGSGLSLYRSEMPLYDRRFSLHLFGAENSIQIGLVQMAEFVMQIDSILVWERMHPDS